MKKTRLFAVLLAATLVVAAFCACFSVSAEGTNIALNKTYTGVAVSTHDQVKGYNAKLTDGKAEGDKMGYGKTEDEWFCFYYSADAKGEGNVNVTLDANNKRVAEMTIDLASLSSVEKVRIHFNKDYNACDLKVEISDNADSGFKTFATKTVAKGDGEESGSWGRWVELTGDTQNGRYVKVTFTFDGMFCILNEVEVIGTEGVSGGDSGNTGADTSKEESNKGDTSTTTSEASSEASSTASSTASSAASSTASSATSSNKPASGDAGLLCFAVIAVVSIAGVAVAVKVRK